MRSTSAVGPGDDARRMGALTSYFRLDDLVPSVLEMQCAVPGASPANASYATADAPGVASPSQLRRPRRGYDRDDDYEEGDEDDLLLEEELRAMEATAAKGAGEEAPPPPRVFATSGTVVEAATAMEALDSYARSTTAVRLVVISGSGFVGAPSSTGARPDMNGATTP